PVPSPLSLPAALPISRAREMLALQPCDLRRIEYSRLGDATCGERVLHECLERAAQPASHRDLKSLLAMIDDRRRQPLRRDPFQDAFLIEATKLEIRRNTHHFLHEAMIEIRHAQFQRVPHAQPELRVPYLDHRFVEEVMSIPANLKLRGLNQK